MSNKVELTYFDKKEGYGRAVVNEYRRPEQQIALSMMDSETDYDEKNFRPKRDYVAYVAHDFNMSSPFYLRARTLKGLLGKIKRYKYNLVRPNIIW